MSSELLTLFIEFICNEGQGKEQQSKLVSVCGFPQPKQSNCYLSTSSLDHVARFLLHSLAVTLSLIRYV